MPHASARVTGIGTVMVDIPVRLSTDQLLDVVKHNSLRQGHTNILPPDKQLELLRTVSPPESSFAAGGSVANSMVALAQLGGSAVHIGRAGDDRYGKFFMAELDRVKVSWSPQLVIGGTTGTAVNLIDPAGDYTLCVSAATNRDFSPADIDDDLVKQSKWLMVQGHYLAYGEVACGAVFDAIKFAHRIDNKIVLTLGAVPFVERSRQAFHEILPEVDLLIGNEHEAMTLTQTDSTEKAISALKQLVPNFVVTLGSSGVFARWQGEERLTAAIPVIPVDKTGAGDLLAGSFLYGVTNGIDLKSTLEGAVRLSAYCVTQVGARLKLEANRVQELFHKGSSK